MKRTGILRILSSIFCLVALCGSTTAKARDDVSRELKEILSDLNVLNDNVQSITKVSRETGLGRQTTEAELSFFRANEAFSRGQWLTVQQEVQRYFTVSQNPRPQTWMRAQFMLGRAYEERSQPSRAARAYLRYLSTFVTAKQTTYNEMGEVLERLVKVATKGSGGSKNELNQFLSGLAALKVPDEFAPELRYFTSVGGAKIGQKNFAQAWLTDISANASRPDHAARALNFKALLAMQDNNWLEAEESLQKIITMQDLKGSSIDGARLSLARVYLKLKKPNTALEIYQSFKMDSSVYREALFEKTFVLIRQNRGDLARQSAAQYLDKYPEHPDALQMRAIRSWLEIHSGNLMAAKSSIDDTASELEGIRSQVQSILTGKVALNHLDAKKLMLITNGLVTASTELEDTLAMFEQMADLDSRLDEVNGVVLNLLYAIAKSDLDRYKPALANRTSQLTHAFARHTAITERHIATETLRLSKALSDLDLQKLKSSAKRRKNMETQTARLVRESKRLVTWIGPAEQLAALAQTWTRLGALSSQKTGSMSDSPLDVRSGNLRGEILNTLTEIRREQAKSLVDQSSLNGLRSTFQVFSASVHDDETILASYEPIESQTLDVLDDSDSQAAWSKIRKNSSVIYDCLVTLEKDARQDLTAVLSQIDNLLSMREKMSKSLRDLRDVLEKNAGSASATILSHYDSVLGQRIARQQKWSGDIDYLTYTEKSSQHIKDRKTHELGLQVLTDNLWEEEQGGSIQWKR